MSDKNRLVLGGIHFGPARTTPDVSIRPTPINLSPSPALKIRCLISDCPNNKEYACLNPQMINIGLNGKCLFGDDARNHAREQERRDVTGTP